MRYSAFVLVLLALAALAGYAAGARPVQAQAESVPFRVGETVVFSLDGGGSRTCRVDELKGVFARCGGPQDLEPVRYGDPKRQEEWINVMAVEVFYKTSERK